MICNDDKDNLIAEQQDFTFFSARMNIHYSQGRVAQFGIVAVAVETLQLTGNNW